MRKQIFQSVFAFLMCGTISLVASAFAVRGNDDEPPGKKITASGCVTTGVEAGCLMLTDSKTGTVYNVHFRGRGKPAVGSAIRITATEHDGPTTCMEGRAVKVESWFQLKMKCLPKRSE